MVIMVGYGPEGHHRVGHVTDEVSEVLDIPAHTNQDRLTGT